VANQVIFTHLISHHILICPIHKSFTLELSGMVCFVVSDGIKVKSPGNAPSSSTHLAIGESNLNVSIRKVSKKSLGTELGSLAF
jgi:hypothetical protein